MPRGDSQAISVQCGMAMRPEETAPLRRRKTRPDSAKTKEHPMRGFAVLLVSAFIGFAPAAMAQAPTPDTENGRYSVSPVTDGMLRLDTRTGAVSLCARQAAGWACNVVPDERQALENEIARLQRENGALKKDMLARGLPLPGGVASAPPADKQRELNLKVPLPSDAEIDRVMSAFEKMWRRLVDMVQKTPGSDRI
jgi:hypothetical protein